ncbi:MAG: DUF4349 domain-containing protein [Coriobacteriia bacterium]|nr:DUF4349 domain-containing protein [Coriobacteriia bacterium]MCL2750106.1 DUF4349 domain-containing protein [Coriobacteriia bacterium]
MKNLEGKTKQVLAILLALILLVSLGACSGNSSNYATSGGGVAPEYDEQQVSPYQPTQVESGSFGYTTQADEAATLTVEDYEVPYMPQDSVGGADAGQPANQSVANEPSPPTQPNTSGNVQEGRKITFWASLAINTKSFDAEYQAIMDMVNQSGGYVASESMTDSASYYDNSVGRRTTVSIKIPATGYHSFVDGLSNIGVITSRNMWSDDLTAAYFDTASRIEMLEIRKERLMNYLIEAERAEDIVAFERELSSVLYELDSYQGNLRQLNQLVDYSTVEITLTELITPETIGPDGEPLGDRVSTAFALSVNSVGLFLQDVLVFLVQAAPWLGLLLAVALVVWLLVQGIRKSREKYSETGFAKARQERKNEKNRKKMEKRYLQQQLYQYPQVAYQQAQEGQAAPQDSYPAPVGLPLEIDEQGEDK